MHLNNKFSSLTKKDTLKKFNKEYFELLDFIKLNTQDKKFKIIYSQNKLLNKTMNNIFIKIWYKNINQKYYNEIVDENLDFFLYNEFNNTNYSLIESKVINLINILKIIVKNIDSKELQKIIIKIKDLTLLSEIYKNNFN